MKRSSLFWSACLLATTVAAAAPMVPARLEAFARLPDFSGYWRVIGANGLLEPGVKAAKGTAAYRDHPPYNATWEAKYVAALAQMRTAAKLPNGLSAEDSYNRSCQYGPIRQWSRGQQLEFLLEPERIFMLYDGEYRVINTDGRRFPDADAMVEQSKGYSIGVWNGETLSVETAHAGPAYFWADDTPLLFSEDMRMTEVFRRTGRDRMEVTVTFRDDQSLTRPWTIRRSLQLTAPVSDQRVWSDAAEVCFLEKLPLTR